MLKPLILTIFFSNSTDTIEFSIIDGIYFDGHRVTARYEDRTVGKQDLLLHSNFELHDYKVEMNNGIDYPDYKFEHCQFLQPEEYECSGALPQ